MLSKPTYDKLIDERTKLLDRLKSQGRFDVVTVSLPKLTIKVCIGITTTDSRRAIDQMTSVCLKPTDDEKYLVCKWLMEQCKDYHFKISKRYGSHVANYYLKVDWDYWYELDKQEGTD